MRRKLFLLMLVMMLISTNVAISFQNLDKSNLDATPKESTKSDENKIKSIQNGIHSIKAKTESQTENKGVPFVTKQDKSDKIKPISTNSIGGGGMITTLVIPSFSKDFNESTHQINGVLKGFGNDFWDNEVVTLYRTSDLTKNLTLDTALNSVITGDPITYENKASIITDIDGVFSFNINFNASDIDDWIYFVFFAGDGPRGEGLVYKEFLTIRDTTDFTISVSRDNVGISQVYIYTIQGTSKATGLGSTLQGVKVRLNENYVHGNQIPGSTLFNQNLTLNSAGVATRTSIYGHDGFWGSSDNDNITLTVDFPDNFPLTKLPAPMVRPSIVSVSNKFKFEVNATVDGLKLDKSNATVRYHRLGQNVSFIGQLVNTTLVGTGTPQELQNSLFQNQTLITIPGWGGGPLPTLQTNETGFVTFSFLFNETNFPNLSQTGNTFFSITFNIQGAQLVSDRFETYRIYAKENISSIIASDDSPHAFYHPGSDSIVVEGQVIDSYGKGAADVAINLNINDKTAPGNLWVTVTEWQLEVYTGITNETGYFTITISDFNFNFITPQITINLTISNTQTNLDWNTTSLSLITFETSTFNYYSSIITQIEVNLQDGNGFQLINSTMEVFNETFVDYFNNNILYRISITDQYLRNATGLFANITGPDGTTSFVVTPGVSNFTFSIASVTNFNQVLFNSANSTFSYGIVIASPFSQLRVIYTDIFILFGPDNDAPDLSGNPIHPSETFLENLTIGENVTIVANIDTSKSALDNIQFVVLYYMLSTNTPIVIGDANFPADFTGIQMIYQGGVLYQENITFFEHGTWVRYYIEIVDFAGHGLLGRYISNSTNLPLGYTNYTTSFTHNTTTNVFEFKMGDNEIFVDNPLNLLTSIKINGTNLDQNTDTNPGENIRIDIYLPEDNLIGDYLNVTISYEVRIYDVDKILLSTIPFANVTMIQIGWVVQSQTYRYQIVINGSSFDYFYEVNYLFYIYDQSENLYETEEIINVVINDPDYSNTEVADNVDPIDPDNTRIIQSEITAERNNTSTVRQVYNETETGTVSYNITDAGIGIGIGIGNIYLSILYYDADGELLFNETQPLVINGTITFIGTLTVPYPGPVPLWLSQISNNGTMVNVTQTGDYYFVEFDIDFTRLEVNSTVSWQLLVTDIAGNPRNVNPQGQDFVLDPYRFSVISPPPPIIPDVEVSETVILITTVDSDGNPTVITSTKQIFLPDEDDSGNALLIILAFSILVFGITLYYQRHNIREYFERSARKRKARSTLSELIDEIKRLGAEERYKSAIKLVWEALERLSKEILQVPRSYNQTAREFASYLSTVTIVDRETLLTISNTFEGAKYGKDEPTYDDWDDAVKALDITVNTIIESGARVQIEDDDDDDFD